MSNKNFTDKIEIILIILPNLIALLPVKITTTQKLVFIVSVCLYNLYTYTQIPK